MENVIRQLINGLNAIQSTTPETVVDLLCDIHESGVSGSLPTVDLTKLLKDQFSTTGSKTQQARKFDPFPDFAAEFNVDEATADARSLPNHQELMSLLQDTLVSYQELLKKYNQDFDLVFANRQSGETETEDQTLTRLKAAQLALVKYPIAGQAIFAALIREGRQFAKTEQGQVIREQLENSPQLAKARTLFEGLNGGVLAEENGDLPSTYIDGFLDALDRDLEIVLGELGGVEVPS